MEEAALVSSLPEAFSFIFAGHISTIRGGVTVESFANSLVVPPGSAQMGFTNTTSTTSVVPVPIMTVH